MSQAKLQNYSFSKQQRLLSGPQYDSVFDKVDIKQGGKYFTFLATNRTDSSHNRLGLIVAKKHIKTAVARNRIKRQIREFFRYNSAEYERQYAHRFDLIVIVKSSAVNLEKSAIAEALAKQWQKFETKYSNVDI